MGNKKLNDEFGLSDKDIDKLMEEADNERDSLSNLSEDELKAIQERKEKADALKRTLKETRGMENKSWAEAIIKSSIENAVIAQHLAIGDLEDNFESKKVSSMSELTNAITSGASELVKMDHQERHLEISQEKNDIRKMEASGKGGPIIEGDGKTIEAIGKGKDLLKLIKSQEEDEEIEVDINTDTTEDETNE